MDASAPIMDMISFMEGNNHIEQIDKDMYNNDFQEFYNIHLEKYNNNLKDTQFCSANHTGVSHEFLIDTINKSSNATLISLDIDESNHITEIYALLTFRISNKKMAVEVKTLCGNRTLPPSGEGTRLLKLVESISNVLGYSKIYLNPLETAIPYYKSQRYRKMEQADSSDSLSVNSNSNSEPSPMQKNMHALSHWNKLRTAVNVSTLLNRTRKKRAARELHDRYTEKLMNPPYIATKSATVIVPGSTLNHATRKFRPRAHKKIPTKIIIPGESLHPNPRSKSRPISKKFQNNPKSNL